MDYENFFSGHLATLRAEGRYRVFVDIERIAGRFPRARDYSRGQVREVTVWCSNDYLAMGQHPEVLQAMHAAIDVAGAGSGGTRNISGNNHFHVLLEKELADWTGKEAALLFTSGYVANQTTLSTIAGRLPGCIVFSDALNHNSMIEGIRQSRAARRIFRHNDLGHLEELLAQAPAETPKLIAFESVYSMDGDIAPIGAICDLADKYGAITFLDEVHAVGMYGLQGSGIAERDGLLDRVTIYQATLAKAIGVIGGFITGSANLIDFVRSFGPGFIFSSALPPSVAAGALASIRFLRDHPEIRERHAERANTLRRRLRTAGLPFIDGDSHIVPLIVGEAGLCKQASDELLDQHGIYVQPINYPTVPVGTERLRITATPLHTDAMMDELVGALLQVWQSLGLKRKAA